MDWLGENVWAVWLAAAVILGVIEMTTLDLVFGMLAVGALAGALVAVPGLSVPVQVIVAGVVAVGMLALVRPVALRHLRQPLGTRTGVAALLGRQAITLSPVDAHGGQVKLGGEVWSARSFDPQVVIPAGRTVDVVEIDGATAVVYESEL